ncbi:hypothetical protein EMIHUDRAFT_70871, partial [Emiliania huxleyi CCMP1516]|uniref:Peptidase S8/S53 domain-containing protein n=3 Tax=Emiliania huxleyi TaxID=2903 RepID=A0A0D3KK46_EMIH1
MGQEWDSTEWHEDGIFEPGPGRGDHGTHVASAIAGDRFGVAKGATVVPVQVLQNIVQKDSQGEVDEPFASGPTSLFLLALDWIVTDFTAAAANTTSGRRGCVINLSYGGKFSGDVYGWFSLPEDALAAVEAAGCVVIKAAGNDGGAACNTYPAASRHGISVGATGKPRPFGSDPLLPWSNHGCCSDIFAPGESILAA